MSAPTRGIAAGTNLNFIGFYDQNGLLTGGTTTAPSAGVAAGNPFDHIYGVQTASPTVGEPDQVVITGDDIRLGEFDFESIASRAFTIELAAFDLDQEAQLLGTNVQTIGETKIGAMDIVDRVELNACIILQGRTKKQDIGVKGLKAYSGVIIPLCNVIPLGRGSFESRGAASWRYRVTPQVASNYPWGVTIAEATAGTTGLTYIPFTSDYPIHMHVFEGNGIATSWTLQHRPVAASKTSIFFNRSAGTISLINTSTRAATSNAGSGRAVVYYEFDQFNES